jgi:hypothetical protein
MGVSTHQRRHRCIGGQSGIEDDRRNASIAQCLAVSGAGDKAQHRFVRIETPDRCDAQIGIAA